MYGGFETVLKIVFRLFEVAKSYMHIYIFEASLIKGKLHIYIYAQNLCHKC